MLPPLKYFSTMDIGLCDFEDSFIWNIVICD